MFVLNVNKKCDIQWKHICWIPLSPIVIFICWRLSILQAHSKNIFFSLPKHCCIITLILEGQIVWPMGGQGLQLPGWQAQFLISFHKRVFEWGVEIGSLVLNLINFSDFIYPEGLKGKPREAPDTNESKTGGKENMKSQVHFFGWTHMLSWHPFPLYKEENW